MPAYGADEDAMSDGYRRVPAPHGGFTVAPMPSQEELADFYREEYYQDCSSATFSAEYTDEEMRWKRLQCDFVLHLLQRHGLDGGRLLDVGSGEGFLVDAAVRAGYDARGVDFSAFAVQRFHPHLADRITAGDAMEVLRAAASGGTPYDACVLQHVVEHVREPDVLLDAVTEAVRPGGLVLVTIPNDASPIQRLAMAEGHIDREFWFAPPQHLHYFDTTTGPAFVEDLGFEVLDHVTDFPIDLYLLHPGSNYVADPEQGKAAHRARVQVELMVGAQGLDRMRALGAAQARCGLGRDQTMVLRRRR